MLERSAYENRIQLIIESIITNSPIVLTKKTLDISGNLDAKKIKAICDKHRIRYTLQNKGVSLEKVKNFRNDLAHGDVSFSECARDLTIDDLETIKDEVLIFLDDILQGMKRYYDGKLYKIS
ncbi:MAE_28990/MAE_18760 family HEPN-like nuclease [Pelotomaculum isophthalicicum JI]|uniref:MAE_28990/MAE_18760 family HEPN-like nuclease n=1 Tax=Pelotomaculum isophthalicicum JI TaxID=947010 RepID=A0A9X4H6M2_9FIRM|nr:MAE_28990/MAE_18760 family HEPN-like nuclease [Pelotomaculum isophthalicicum]MDF9407039.1 MAE_28990/MAE_18760 family HEPN-like nuclease [Pelotomaculum isophthalicicum JI]